jgi:hypothetical protein
MKTRIAFTLSMPCTNSWNGRWSGDGRLFVIVRSYNDKRAKQILSRSSYRYSFGDGWVADVSVEEVDEKQARSLRRRSDGFQSYDWMVNSIEMDGEIYGPMRPKPQPELSMKG